MTNIQTQNDALNNQNNITRIASGGEQLQKQVLKAFKTSTNKTLSPAFLKIKTARDDMNSGCQCWVADDLSSMVYMMARDGNVFARGYRGRSKKAAFYSRFTSEESRAGYVTKWMRDRSENQQQAEDRRKAKPRAIATGDILYAVWGWEQTNVNYYKVLELVGSQSVVVIEIGKITDYNHGSMSGTCLPDIENQIGKPFTRRVSQGDCIKVNSVTQASKLDHTFEEGKKKYKSSYYSTYA